MHYTYVEGKRVSNHLMKDCRSFIKLQEAAGSKQAEARSQEYARTPGTTTTTYNAPPPPLLRANKAAPAQGHCQQNQGNKNDRRYISSKGHIATMIQPVPRSNKEQNSIFRQVNLQ
jgi:hypothetical protein